MKSVTKFPRGFLNTNKLRGVNSENNSRSGSWVKIINIVHFMSKKGLEKLAGNKNVTLRSPNSSIDRLVSILSSAIAHSTPTLSTEEQTIEVKKSILT